MTDPHLVAAAVHFVPTLVWTLVTLHLWRLRRLLQPRRILPPLAALFAVHHGLHMVIELTPNDLDGRLPGLHAAIEAVINVAVVWGGALFLHLVVRLTERGVSHWRVAVTVSDAAAVAASIVALMPLWAPVALAQRAGNLVREVPIGYMFVVCGTALTLAAQLARRGVWRPGIAVSELLSADVLVMFVIVLGLAVLGPMMAVNTQLPPSARGLLLHTAVGLVTAIPFVVRMLGRIVRGFLVAVGTIAATMTIHFGGRTLVTAASGPEAARLVDLATLALLFAVLGPGRLALRRAVERFVFRRDRERQARLQAFVHTLAPEEGVAACCQRALRGLGEIMKLRGTAILLDDGQNVANGNFPIDAVAQVWPRGPAADVPARAIREAELQHLPRELTEVLMAAQVVWVVPVASPRRRWGYLLATEGLLSTPSSEEDVEEASAFVTQLALVLDGAELLARALAVERSLAHAEKLAAIGETAARIAHEIRNPVTAARSLAQQLAREAAAGDGEPARLILAELERVERQVAALLRFSRRDELRFEAVDLRELVGSTVDGFQSRLDAAGIAVALDAGATVVARADREKLRQVLINLIENAIDALAHAGDRRLAVSLATVNGSAVLRIADTGPGVDADALSRLFEPFFSQKEKGTGLGLAIVRRTVEAHGGRVTAAPGPDGGLAFDVTLPLERASA
jgi:signal transduction histidine kinase